VDAPSLPTTASPPRILVVDDELPLLRICARALRPCIVEVASSGALALARLAVLPAFDLVVCDLHLLDFLGRDLYRHVCALAPELRDRFLFMTGDRAASPHDFDDDSASVRVLSKPFEPAALRAAVHDLLGRLPPRGARVS
jgi:CheY-like chemotaxis protein